jgi:hypothetical protein
MGLADSMGQRHPGGARWTLGALGLSIGWACTRAEPPTPAGTPWQASPEVDVSTAAAAAGSADAGVLPTRSTDAAPSSSAGASPASTSDSALLPQTTDKPAASSAPLDQRVALLWSAIVHDDPDTATPAFFPLGAYAQVKDVADPAADWKHRLLAAFRRDIHAFHAALGDEAATPRFVSFDVPEARARWVDPGEEWNKIGYFRVFGSKLRYVVAGDEHAFEVKSLISWRGEWYVVHLAAIK